MRSARLRELVNLVMVGVLTAVGFASVYTARENQISSTSLIYAGFFLALFAVAHIGVRAGLPNADPWLLPLAALLCALGLTEIYRLQPTLARDQSVWIVVGLIGFLGLVFVLRDHRRLEAYKYSLATVAVGLLLFTMVAGTTVNGARLWIRVGGDPGPAGRVREAPARRVHSPATCARTARCSRSPAGACSASASRPLKPPGPARADGGDRARRCSR